MLTKLQDPRQFVPPSGQSWTSHSRLLSTHANKWQPIKDTQHLWSIFTEPKVAIGQRCILVQTPNGNVLWDCITLLDQGTKDFITEKGGLKAIVISHPHYYTTHLEWAREFQCPVYIAQEDEEWCQRADSQGLRKLITETTTEIIPGVTAIKVGGHFPGSLVLHTDGEKIGDQINRLYIADSFVTVPSAFYHKDRPVGTTSYSFMWSIPNMIPLPPEVMLGMWRAMKGFEWQATHGAFVGTEVVDEEGNRVGGREVGVRERVLESMKIQARGEGWDDGSAGIFAETV